jgi:hypothetical protein
MTFLKLQTIGYLEIRDTTFSNINYLKEASNLFSRLIFVSKKSLMGLVIDNTVYKDSSISFLSFEGLTAKPGIKVVSLNKLDVNNIEIKENGFILEFQEYLNEVDSFPISIKNSEFKNIVFPNLGYLATFSQ